MAYIKYPVEMKLVGTMEKEKVLFISPTLAILGDPGDSFSCNTPKMMNLFQLTKVNHVKQWLVSPTTRAKQKVTDLT